MNLGNNESPPAVTSGWDPNGEGRFVYEDLPDGFLMTSYMCARVREVGVQAPVALVGRLAAALHPWIFWMMWRIR